MRNHFLCFFVALPSIFLATWPIPLPQRQALSMVSRFLTPEFNYLAIHYQKNRFSFTPKLYSGMASVRDSFSSANQTRAKIDAESTLYVDANRAGTGGNLKIGYVIGGVGLGIVLTAGTIFAVFVTRTATPLEH